MVGTGVQFHKGPHGLLCDGCEVIAGTECKICLYYGSVFCLQKYGTGQLSEQCAFDVREGMSDRNFSKQMGRVTTLMVLIQSQKNIKDDAQNNELFGVSIFRLRKCIKKWDLKGQ